jgi:lipoprotein-anchoring transpeptidase ErfK/SrfK
MTRTRLEIDLARQRLRHYEGGRLVREYWVSTARNGPGEVMHSECTPRGRHAIAEKIGAGAPLNSVFVGRRPTGEIWSPAFAATQPAGRDWILTRILWLAGLEPGVNQGGEVDSHARYIYLHGTPDDTALGRPGSRGCVRMRNRDIVELFERVEVGDEVLLYER